MILEFNTKQDALSVLTLINNIAAGWWQSQGYTVYQENGQNVLVGKNAKTGNDEPDKATTLTWATIEESPEGTFYFSDPASNPNFENWKDHVPENVTLPDYVAKKAPQEWFEDEESNL